MLSLVATALAQEDQSGFLLDASRPFVYVAFDHTGPRQQVTQGESPNGLWLRLVNNCKIPIEVRTFDLGTTDPGVGINYDVVPVGGIFEARPPTRIPRGYSSPVCSPVVIKKTFCLGFRATMSQSGGIWKRGLILPSRRLDLDFIPIASHRSRWRTSP
jgi:hypothetical protein